MEGFTRYLLLCALCIFHLNTAYSLDAYDFKGLEVDKILSNKRLLDSHIKCYLNKGPCTPLLNKVKNSLAEVMETKCKSCNETQMKQFRQAMSKIRDTRPDDFDAIIKKYAPKSWEQFADWLKN